MAIEQWEYSMKIIRILPFIWKTAADILTLSYTDTLSDLFYQLYLHIVFMQEYAPDYIATTFAEEELEGYQVSRYKKEIVAGDYLLQVNAMMLMIAKRAQEVRQTILRTGS